MPSVRHFLASFFLRVTRFNRAMVRDIQVGNVVRAQPKRSDTTIKKETFQGHAVWHFTPLIVTPDTTISDSVIYYLHGGAFVYGMLPVHFKTLKKLATRSGCHIIAPCYPLPPEQTGRDIIDYCTAYLDNLETAYGIDNIILMGDSAGGGLALSLLQTRVKAARPVPPKLILWSPWVDLSMSNPATAKMEGRDPTLGLDGITQAGARYAEPHNPKNPAFSPLFGDMTDLPPTVIFTGDQDILHPDIIVLSNKMMAANVKLKVITETGLGHYWMFLPVPEAQRTLRQTANIIQSQA